MVGGFVVCGGVVGGGFVVVGAFTPPDKFWSALISISIILTAPGIVDDICNSCGKVYPVARRVSSSNLARSVADNDPYVCWRACYTPLAIPASITARVSASADWYIARSAASCCRSGWSWARASS